MFVDRRELLRSERGAFDRADTFLDLRPAACADQGCGNGWLAKDPRDRHLRERLAATLSEIIERTNVVQILFAEHVLAEGPAE